MAAKAQSNQDSSKGDEMPSDEKSKQSEESEKKSKNDEKNRESDKSSSAAEKRSSDKDQPKSKQEDKPSNTKQRDQQSPEKSSAVPNRRRMVAILVIAFVVVAVGAGWMLISLSRSADETYIELMGNIDVRQVNLGFKVDGRIDTLAVDEGDSVKSGDVIATLDKKYFNDELRILRSRRDNLAANLAKLENGSRPEEIAQVRAQTADREAALTKAKEDHHRAQQLVEKGGVSRQEFDRYQSALDSAQAQLNSAKESQRLVEIGPRQEDIDIARAQLAEQDATIAQSERRLADADLYAPNDGTILTRARERGAIVQATETVFTLTLSTPVWVRTYVNERDLGLISPDMQVSVLTDSAPDKPYTGKIGFISPTAEFTPKTVETRDLRTSLVYRLRVVVDNPDSGLRQGMPVTVRVELQKPRPRTFWQRVRDGSRSRFYSHR